MRCRGPLVAILCLLVMTAGVCPADLVESVQAGDIAAVRALLAAAADPNAAAPEGPTALYFAALEGHADIFHLLIDAGASTEAATTADWSLLLAAVYGGQEDLVTWLLDRGADVSEYGHLWQNGLYGTLLHVAVRRGNAEMVRLLLARGARVGVPTDDKWAQMPLHLAAVHRHADIAGLLIERGADVDALAGYRRTALHFASYRDAAAVARTLLEHGADPNPVDRHGKTPLHYAADAGNADLVRLLLDHGADVTAFGEVGCSPLELAAGGGHTEAFDALLGAGAEWTLPVAVIVGDAQRARDMLAAGADPSEAGYDGIPALHRAISGDHPGIARTLIEAGAALDVVYQWTVYFPGVTALSLAAERGHGELVDLLLARGADLHLPGELDRPLFDAVRNGHAAIVAALLEHGANPHAAEWTGATPLHWAALGTDAEIVRLLLDAGANANVVAEHMPEEPTAADIGQECDTTPLHWAAAAGRLQAVGLLLEHSADVEARTASGLGALGIALGRGHEEIAAVLREHGGVQ